MVAGTNIDFAGIVNNAIQQRLHPSFEADQATSYGQPERSLRHTLLRELAAAAEQHAAQNAVDELEFEEAVLAPALNVVDAVASGLSEVHSRPKQPFNFYEFWTHYNEPVALVTAKQSPYMNRDLIIEAVDDYLQQPVRSEVLDRLLIDLLVALEVYAFADEMYNKPFLSISDAGNSPRICRPPLQESFWKTWLITCLGISGFYALLGVVVLGVCWLFDISLKWPAAFLVAIYAFNVLRFVLETPSDYREFVKDQARIRSMLQVLSDVYVLLADKSVIDAKRVQEAVVEAEGKGIVWPKSLLMVLDDSIARDGALRNW